MATKSERTAILESLENEYRHDLALHLYSTFLLHRVNPLFPRRNWSSWPLTSEEVPDPRISAEYGDNVVDNSAFENDIDTDGSGSEGKDELAESETDLSDEESIDDVDKKMETMQIMKIRSVSYRESVSNSKADLLNAIASLVERKIQQRNLALGVDPSRISVDISRDIKLEIGKKIGNRVNDVFNEILAICKSSIIKKSAKRKFNRLLNWQDVIIASMNSVMNSDYQNIIKRSEKLFENVKYNYDFDDEQSHSKRPKTLGEYHNLLEEENSFNATYKNLREHLHNKRIHDNRFKELKNLAIYNTIKNNERFKTLLWSLSGTKSQAKKRYRIKDKAQDMNAIKELALSHGGSLLTETDYIIPLD